MVREKKELTKEEKEELLNKKEKLMNEILDFINNKVQTPYDLWNVMESLIELKLPPEKLKEFWSKVTLPEEKIDEIIAMDKTIDSTTNNTNDQKVER